MKIRKKEFTISVADIATLETIRKGGVFTPREVKRAEILLHVSAGKSPEEISQWMKRSEGNIYDICNRYQKGGLERALYDAPRSGQPPKLDLRQESEITVLACSDAPEGHARWSIRLLHDNVIKREIVDTISREKIRLFLKKTNLSLG